ncbi:MAG: hypothetical protein JKY46_08160 [Robiginitomaculum sp.]|nr:hypothetical protein [Robiginitomaculum sp.]
MENQQHDFTQARHLFALGLSYRQIARKLDVLPSVIKAQALQQQWPTGTQTNWRQLRARFERGENITDIANSCTVSLSTLRKRKRRENWSQVTITGLDALRRSVSALQTALDSTPEDDPVLTTRISTALSMAAARLSRSEKGLAPIEFDAEISGIDDADDQQAVAELARVMHDWRVDGVEKVEEQKP